MFYEAQVSNLVALSKIETKNNERKGVNELKFLWSLVDLQKMLT